MARGGAVAVLIAAAAGAVTAWRARQSQAYAGSGEMILDRLAAGEITTEHLATHVLPVDGPRGYTMFKDKEDGCVRAVFQPNR